MAGNTMRRRGLTRSTALDNLRPGSGRGRIARRRRAAERLLSHEDLDGIA
jgi:hypothetical protein